VTPPSKKPAAKKPGRKTLGGPELKMPSFKKASFKKPSFNKPSMRMPSGPSIKAPAPIAGVVAGLRERRLLPVVLVLVAAIVAVPFLLGKSKDAPPVHPPSVSAGTVGAAGAPTAVVTASDQSGVREYNKRLSGGGKDPFVPEYKTETSASSQVAATGVSSGTATPSASSTSPAPSGGGTSSPGTTPGSSGGSGQVWLTHTVDLYAYGTTQKHPQLRENVRAGESLPNDKQRPAAFFGVPFSAPGQAWFAIAGEVEIVSTEGKCALGKTTCQIVALKPGDSLKLRAYGDKYYVIKLVRIERLVTTQTPK
jgi:hypothetical protein